MIIDIRPKISKQYRIDLLNEYNSLLRMSKTYANKSRFLLLQLKAKTNTLSDKESYESNEEYNKHLMKFLDISSAITNYAKLCKETLDRIHEIELILESQEYQH